MMTKKINVEKSLSFNAFSADSKFVRVTDVNKSSSLEFAILQI